LASSSIYDVFINPGGELSFSAAWASTLLRTNDLERTYGMLHKNGDAENRYLGTLRMSGATQGYDSKQHRLLWNMANRVRKAFFVCPAYTDDNAGTYYSLNSATWALVNGGGNDSVYWVTGLGGQMISLKACAYASISANQGHVGIGIDWATYSDVNAECCLTLGAASEGNGSCEYNGEGVGQGYHQGDLLGCAIGGSTTLTFYSDMPRNGAGEDPPVTFLTGSIMC